MLASVSMSESSDLTGPVFEEPGLIINYIPKECGASASVREEEEL